MENLLSLTVTQWSFSDQLAPLLLGVHNYSQEHGCLPATFLQASVSPVHKKDKDSFNCTNYRPNSLLRVNVKILFIDLASHIESIMPFIISEDQTGFIKGRHSFSNIRRLLDIVHSPPILIKLEVLLTQKRPSAESNGPTFSTHCKNVDLVTVLSRGSNYYTLPLRQQYALIPNGQIFTTFLRHTSGLFALPFVICAGNRTAIHHIENRGRI